MATVHRTFVNRGKKEVTELKPNFVYAVEYVLNSDTARTLGIRTEQVGIIVVDHYGKISHNYNLQNIGAWSKGSILLNGKKVWYASDMEIEFATNYVNYEDICNRFNNLRVELRDTRLKFDEYKKNKLHRIADKILRIWCKMGL